MTAGAVHIRGELHLSADSLKRRPLRGLISLIAIGACLGASRADAGPPYVTDDPAPTDYRNWEIYAPGIQFANTGKSAVSASAPFAEFNYGAFPNIQVSTALSQEYDRTAFSHQYGYGDTHIGVKYRFLQESDHRPQVAFFPSIDIPSAAGAHVVTRLPLWLQKSFGQWTAFGGGGLNINPGPGNRDYTLFGAALTRALSPATTLGIELFHQGAATTGANLGVESKIGRYHAIVFSCGRALGGSTTFSGYLAYKFST